VDKNHSHLYVNGTDPRGKKHTGLPICITQRDSASGHKLYLAENAIGSYDNCLTPEAAVRGLFNSNGWTLDAISEAPVPQTIDGRPAMARDTHDHGDHIGLEGLMAAFGKPTEVMPGVMAFGLTGGLDDLMKTLGLGPKPVSPKRYLETLERVLQGVLTMTQIENYDILAEGDRVRAGEDTPPEHTGAWEAFYEWHDIDVAEEGCEGWRCEMHVYKEMVGRSLTINNPELTGTITRCALGRMARIVEELGNG
jgi:hypothetical protein